VLARSSRSDRERCERLNRNLSVFDDQRVRCQSDPRFRFPRKICHVADCAHARNLERRPERRVSTVNEGLEEARYIIPATKGPVGRNEGGVVVVVLENFLDAMRKRAEMMFKDLLGCCFCLFSGV
jgi:hypothetical protein